MLQPIISPTATGADIITYMSLPSTPSSDYSSHFKALISKPVHKN